jgi:hypothetical protein
MRSSGRGISYSRRYWTKIVGVLAAVALLGCLALTYRVVPGLDGMPPFGSRFMANRRITISSSSGQAHAKAHAGASHNRTAHKISSTPQPQPPPKKLTFPYPDAKYRVHKRPAKDEAAACKQSGICDDTYGCGQDGLGCIRDAAQRRQHVQNAARWSWAGYRCGLGRPPAPCRHTAWPACAHQQHSLPARPAKRSAASLQTIGCTTPQPCCPGRHRTRQPGQCAVHTGPRPARAHTPPGAQPAHTRLPAAPRPQEVRLGR